MRKKMFLILCMSLLLAASLWAGDTAVFVDLGFSPDGQIYMFGQYGVQSGTLRPWAELCVIDVSANDFVSGGKIFYTHDVPVTPGQDGSGALYRLVSRNAALAENYKIGFLVQGRPLYISTESGVSSSSESIDFRDFENGASYRANLNIQLEGSGINAASSFYIRLERQSGEAVPKTYIVGNSRIKRSGVTGYRIRNVMTAPRAGYLVFVIEIKKQNPSGGVDFSYMVEALKL
jgi:predicted secreted protein